MSGGFVFDISTYDALNAARVPVVKQLLESLGQAHDLRTAVDLGCGVGYFSALLRDWGFSVLAVDGRRENLDEAKRRVPGVEFRLADAEDLAIRSLGQFDLALYLGLYYHLENPFQAFRNLLAITRKFAIVEGMVLPGDEPTLGVRDEGPTKDQGLRHVALYPTENGVVKLLYRSGFPHVYRFRTMPKHPNYRNSSLSRQVRTILVAATIPLVSDMLVPAMEPPTKPDPWTIHNSPLALALRLRNFAIRIWNFPGKPWDEKARSAFFHWNRIFPGVPLPIRLPFGAWWLARNDFLGAYLFNGGFENSERKFVQRFLQPGMTVLDIGAHHGFYTLLASRMVGPRGKVLAVEASPRERKRLVRHLQINGCRNVHVEGYALGETKRTADLFLMDGLQSGSNSLCLPATSGPIETVQVEVERLDRVLEERHIGNVDFIKMDVEGAELSVLKGAKDLLSRKPRPVILIEVQDVRTQPWGYPAREIIQFLADIGYFWFRPLPDGRIEKMDATQERYDGNFIAFPAEQVASADQWISSSNESAPIARVSQHSVADDGPGQIGK